MLRPAGVGVVPDYSFAEYEAAIAQARRNANLNQARLKFVHADAFAYARQMQTNGEKWDVVILDPPKFIFTRDEHGNWEGRQKYEDLNLLAISLVKPGGVFVTCSCSGLLSLEDFENHVIKAAHRKGRPVGICGQAPSDYPDFAEWLVSIGIDSLSLNPDSIAPVARRLAGMEDGRRPSTGG